jgi:hypothetical protein
VSVPLAVIFVAFADLSSQPLMVEFTAPVTRVSAPSNHNTHPGTDLGSNPEIFFEIVAGPGI